MNYPILKELSYAIGAFLKGVSWARNSKREQNVILISGLFRFNLMPAKLLKLFFRMKVIVIVPDIPDLMLQYRKDYSFIRKILNKVDGISNNLFRKNIDGYILLTKYMNYVLNKKEKPYLIIEGMVETRSSSKSRLTKSETRKIVYAGKVTEIFGLGKLVSAFIRANIDNCSLNIYGDGDYVDKLKAEIKGYSNIIYGGFVSNETILTKIQEAHLLVDPRPSSLELSMYSFPSKILEYMASGTPVLTTNLPCFDREYANFQYRFDSEDVDNMAIKLSEIMKKSSDELYDFGRKAQKFVSREKGINHQTSKVYRFLKDVDES